MSNNNFFFMEILNNILKINDSEIIIIYDKEGIIWFGLKDILKILGYTSLENAVSLIKIKKKNKQKYNKIKIFENIKKYINISKPNKMFINESGLYELLSNSNKSLAKIFMNKYFTDIMPQIRKTGKYILDKNNKEKMKTVNNKLNLIKKYNKNLLNNQRNIKYPLGNSLYIIIKKMNNHTFYKIGYTSNLNKRLKVYNTGEPNKILFYYYLPILDKTTDTCIKKIMLSEEFIKNKEYYKTTLTKVFKFIKKGNSSLKNVFCGYCHKKYNFTKIILHKCSYI